MSDKSKHSDNGSKYFIDCLDEDDIVRPLCVVLHQMSGYVKYFDDGGKICLLKLKMKVYTWNIKKFGTKLKTH